MPARVSPAISGDEKVQFDECHGDIQPYGFPIMPVDLSWAGSETVSALFVASRFVDFIFSSEMDKNPRLLADVEAVRARFGLSDVAVVVVGVVVVVVLLLA